VLVEGASSNVWIERRRRKKRHSQNNFMTVYKGRVFDPTVAANEKAKLGKQKGQHHL
jgi:hypothetical protein